MSCVGVARASPCAGERMLFADSIKIRASACASADSGTWTAIWSPSKSALNAWQTSGCTWIALPSTSVGSNAWMPRRWGVGARFSSTGCFWTTSSTMSQTLACIWSTCRVDGLLEHPLLLADDGLRRPEIEQPLEAVGPVDHPAVDVVQVGRGEAATVELHHRAQLRRDHRHRLEEHPLGTVLGGDERRDD